MTWGTLSSLSSLGAENEDVLHTYLGTSPRNALYSSKTIQNEMISVIADAIQGKIIDEIQAVKCFTILADEVIVCTNGAGICCDTISGQRQ